MNIHKPTALALFSAIALQAFAQSPGFEPPRQRDVSTTERADLAKTVATRFGLNLPADTSYNAAGPFRVASNKLFSYLERTDNPTSSAIELPDYGLATKPLDLAANGRDVLVPRALDALKKGGYPVDGLAFAGFQDEYVGAGQPQLLAKDFDPRKTSVPVARSLRFERYSYGLPVFGSEVLVGLMPEGTIGRLRYHAPPLDAAKVKSALELSKLVTSGGWTLPRELGAANIKVLEVRAGIGVSSLASLEPRQAPVVRVTYRRTGSDPKLPVQSTRAAYYDAKGAEVLLDDVIITPPTADGTLKGR
ncbi:hypothetical protein [Derxia gummosa]|uniref:Uncharacterized protein n=1 Tax=Derxia gummosa DSM 723 TaxID=1121388 RepID=A0A8B6X4Z0_9BURK|nr:hypothetical protein [Derxia gummosa]